MARRLLPEVNAGSMADIAFLLLIFFLVTTTIEVDSGLSRQLPPKIEIEPPIIKQKNIFQVLVNKDNRLLVEEKDMKVSELREAAKEFLDNGGGTGDVACTYCKGKGDPTSSDNPQKAVISVVNDRQTTYDVYIAVQNELVAAYMDLRDRESERLFGTSYREMEENWKNPQHPTFRSEKIKGQIEQIKDMYPLNLSEAEPKE